MAIVSCPHCGRSISDRSTSCQFCGGPLAFAEDKKSQRGGAVLSSGAKDVILRDGAGALVPFFATVLTVFILLAIDSAVAYRFTGEYGRYCITDSLVIIAPALATVLLIGLAAFCFLPVFCRKTGVNALAAGAILTVILCLICMTWSRTRIDNIIYGISPGPKILNYHAFEPITAWLQKYIPLYAASVPALFGAFALCCRGRRSKAAAVSAALPFVLDILLVSVLGLLLTAVFNYGSFGQGLAHLISGAAVFLAVLVLNVLRGKDAGKQRQQGEQR